MGEKLDKNMDSKTFREFYYLKEELVNFCRDNGLPVSGGKIELTERIAYFLDTGKILKSTSTKTKRKTNIPLEINEESIIEPNFVCSEKHRAFFKAHIGNSFSFNVSFQKWLENKKKNKSSIDKQFEYNTYIRDFFAHNKGKTLEEAIKCWKYKKNLQGHNRYEESDLIVLKG